jgi:DUF971 family protein
VTIDALELVGNAVQPTFSDGYNSGLFSWDSLLKRRTKTYKDTGQLSCHGMLN